MKWPCVMADRAGPVALSMPPDPALARSVRLAAVGLAAMGDFSVERLEDVKLAVSEVLIALIEHGDGDPVHLEMELTDAAFVVRGRTAATGADAGDPDLALCRTVLESICSDHSIAMSDGMVDISGSVGRDNGSG